MQRCYLIVGSQRSGTSFIQRVLAKHEQVTACQNELMVWPLFTVGSDTFHVAGHSLERRRKVTRTLFQQLSRFDEAPDARAIGAKVALERDEDAMDFVTGAKELFDDFLIIRVHRDDLLSRFASMKVAQESNVWWLDDGETRSLPNKILDVASFRAYAEEEQRITSILDELYQSHQVIDVRFENLQSPDWVWPICEALGIDRIDPQPSKRSTPPLEEWLENFEELKRQLDELPPRRSMTREVQEHARSDQHTHRPQFMINRARYQVSAARPEQAQQTLCEAVWRPLSSRLLGQACDLLAQTMTRIGSALQARLLIQQLPKDKLETAPVLALRAHVAVMFGAPSEAQPLLDRAAAASPDSLTTERIHIVATRLKNAPMGRTVEKQTHARRVVIVGPQCAQLMCVTQTLANHRSLNMRMTAVQPWPFLHRGLEAFSTHTLGAEEQKATVRRAFEALVPWQSGRIACGLQLATNDSREALDAVAGLQANLADALIVRLEQPDYVAQFVERVTAEPQDMWTQYRAGSSTHAPQRFDAEAFEVFMTHQCKLDSLLAQLDESHEVVTIAPHDLTCWSGLGHVASALKLSRGGLDEPFWQRPAPVEELVSNLAELRLVEKRVADAAGVPSYASNTSHHLETTRRLLQRARQHLREDEWKAASDTTVSALRHPVSREPATAASGCALLEQVWRRMADGQVARQGLMALESLHGDNTSFLCLQATLEEALGNPSQAVLIAKRALARGTDSSAEEFLRMRELLSRLDAS